MRWRERSRAPYVKVMYQCSGLSGGGTSMLVVLMLA